MKKIYLQLRSLVIFAAITSIFLFATQAGSQAQDIMVKTDGQAYIDAQSHSTWDDATSDLQAAIDGLANNGGGEIWVAGGTYLPNLHFSADPETEDQFETYPSDRYLAFVLRENVTVRGGFMGDENDISERPDNIFQGENTTILSGDVGIADDSSDNSYHVVIFPLGTSDLAVLDGFRITGGNADDGTAFNGRGGGIHARNGGYVINCHISGNSAGARGGGAYLYKGSKFENSAIYENQAGEEGGGIFLNRGGEVIHSAVYNNVCESADNGTPVGNGGGVFLTSNNDEHGSVTYSVITANYSANKGGGVGMYEEFDNNGYPGGELINNLIANNEAAGNGGGVHTQNAGYLLNNTIVNNHSEGGGGVYSNNGGEIKNSVLWGNTTNYGSDNQFQTYGEVTATADYCAIENGTEDEYITNLVSLEPDNEGTSELHPYFLNPASFSGLPTDQTEEAELAQSDYRMDPSSDLIDAGDPNTAEDEFNNSDLAEKPRFSKTAIDIGAYETLYYTITTEVLDETGGAIEPDQTTYILPKEDIQFTLTPEGDNEVVSFTINDTDYKDQLTEEGNSFTYTMTVTENLHAVSEFGVPSFLNGVEEQDVVVYPNPADQQLFIEGVTINRLKIYSLNRKTIMNLQSASSGIDVSSLKQGIYFIEIVDEDQKKHITKFIKK